MRDFWSFDLSRLVPRFPDAWTFRDALRSPTFAPPLHARRRDHAERNLRFAIELAAASGMARAAYTSEGLHMPDGTPLPSYSRVLIKISGEALMGDQGFGLHPPTVEKVAEEIAAVHAMGVEVCMVIGGGNIFRGLSGSAQGMERTTADYMGMLATVMNALAMQSALEARNINTRVISAIPMDQVCEPYIRRRAVRHLEKKRVCIFAAGTGNPYFTTDTAATLRASEMGCQAIFKGTQVDGVYDSDPKTNPDAKRYDTVSYDEVLSKNLKVMDASAIALARDNDLPIVVFSLAAERALANVLNGQGKFTKVTQK
ncbi:MAG: UMP kinase [Pseudomonadota bacterium]